MIALLLINGSEVVVDEGNVAPLLKHIQEILLGLLQVPRFLSGDARLEFVAKGLRQTLLGLCAAVQKQAAKDNGCHS